MLPSYPLEVSFVRKVFGVTFRQSCSATASGPMARASARSFPRDKRTGHEVIAVQYSPESLEEDVAMVKRTLNRVSGPFLLTPACSINKSLPKTGLRGSRGQAGYILCLSDRTVHPDLQRCREAFVRPDMNSFSMDSAPSAITEEVMFGSAHA